MKVYNKAYRFRLLPNKEQKVLFAKTFGCTRFIWNKLLECTKSLYKEHGKITILTPAQFKDQFSFLKEVDSLALANVQLSLKHAVKRCFDVD